jgi:hypothetical protein
VIDAADERFHPRSDDPYWNESAWFGATLPDREASLYIYFYHRPNLQLSAGGVKIWDPSGSTEYDCLGYDWDRTQPLPDGAEMFDFTLSNGLTVKMEEPFGAFAITHRGAFDADLRWERLTEPYAFGPNEGLKGWTLEGEGHTTGHYQQYGRLIGTVTIGGEQIQVDNSAIRDRSWGPRRATAVRRAELMWCATPSAESAFSIYSVSPFEPDQDPILDTTDRIAFGFYRRDGVGSTIVSGTTRVSERGPDGRPLKMQIDGVDELGRELHATGRGLNALVWSVYDRTYQLPCTTVWEFDGQTATGEDWSCLPTELARRMLRERTTVAS